MKSYFTRRKIINPILYIVSNLLPLFSPLVLTIIINIISNIFTDTIKLWFSKLLLSDIYVLIVITVLFIVMYIIGYIAPYTENKMVSVHGGGDNYVTIVKRLYNIARSECEEKILNTKQLVSKNEVIISHGASKHNVDARLAEEQTALEQIKTTEEMRLNEINERLKHIDKDGELLAKTITLQDILDNLFNSPIHLDVTWYGINPSTHLGALGSEISTQIKIDGGSQPYVLEIDFGQGVNMEKKRERKSDQNEKYTTKYSIAGDYSVYITCTDSNGKEKTHKQILHIQ